MKAKRVTLAIGLGLLMSLVGFSQTPPPNDNYSNSITLTGTDVTFTGTLAGATIEDYYPETITYVENDGEAATESVWWNWTATTNTVMTLEVLPPSPAGLGYPYDAIAVYTATNGSSSPEGLQLPALGTSFANIDFGPATLSIPVTAGTNYQIQLIGTSSANYKFRLVATNAPLIVRQPLSKAVNVGAYTVLYVLYAGIGTTNFTFQWQFNGTILSGETAPMLALTNIDPSMAGAYTVTVSNTSGFFAVSDPAMLTVDQTNVPTVLTAVGAGSNTISFSFAGEAGRSYRLKSSTDLVNWSSEADFALNWPWPGTTSVFINTNALAVLTFTNSAAQKYFRVAPYIITDPDSAICINNLEEIRIAKLMWARDDFESVIASPWSAQLLPYFPHGTYPVCPDDPYQSFESSYNLENLETLPKCEVLPATHVLEEPQ
jgi:hypothetical protein